MPYMPLAALVAMLGCGGASDGSGGPTGNPPATASIFVSVSSPTASVVQGASATVSATVNRIGGYTGDVTITTQPPIGITATVGTPSTNGTQTSATITIGAAQATAPGTYTIQITGTGPGVSTTRRVGHARGDDDGGEEHENQNL
ncbi:MAG TPA: hypothetical protein VGM82_08475 [Gemmatimonadaceae bacterium]|jgi:hypothetical protein